MLQLPLSRREVLEKTPILYGGFSAVSSRAAKTPAARNTIPHITLIRVELVDVDRPVADECATTGESTVVSEL